MKNLIALVLATLTLLAFLHFLAFLNAFGNEEAFAFVLAQHTGAFDTLAKTAQQSLKILAFFQIYLQKISPLS